MLLSSFVKLHGVDILHSADDLKSLFNAAICVFGHIVTAA